MHDSPLSQASGLLGLATASGAQLIAVASHGDEQGELPALWRLCAVLSGLEYSVSVLDATQSETADNPGLQQLLDYRFGYGAPENFAAPWNVLPSALGLHDLCAQEEFAAGAALQRIGHLFPANGVVILFAGAELLAALLQGSAVQPLLSVSNGRNSLLTSYLALKRLFISAGLRPTLLGSVGAKHNRGVPHAASVCANLRQCASNFLGYQVDAFTIDSGLSELQQDAQMRRLALHLLESALPLQDPAGQRGAAGVLLTAGYGSRSH